MKVLILGCGKVGYTLSRLLLKEKTIESIVCCDIKINKKIKNKKISYRKIDASKRKQLAKLFKNSDVNLIVNTSLPEFNTNILECCLSRKINYLDLASYWDFDPNPKSRSPYKVEQLDYDTKFKKNNLIGLINAGVAPGLTNLLVRECTDSLDKVDCIKIRLLEDTRSKELCFAWSKEWTLDDINWKPLVYRNGKFNVMESFSEEEEFDFPKPVGKKKVCLISHEEVGTIPLFIKTGDVDIKSYDNQMETLKSLVKPYSISEAVNILSGVPDMFKNKKFKNAMFGLVVEVSGKKGNKRKLIRYSAVFPTQRQIDKLKLSANFISYPTALMTKLFVLSFSKIKKKGVFPPECLDKKIRTYILEQLRKNDISLTKEY